MSYYNDPDAEDWGRESVGHRSIEIDDLNILSVDFNWRYPVRHTARLRIEYLAADDDPRTIMLYGETAISTYQSMRETGRTTYETK